MTELMYQRFFNYSDEILCIADFDGNIVNINDTFCRMIGFSKDELLSRKFIELIHPDDTEKTINEMKRQLHGKSTEGFENRYIDVDGNARLFSWKAHPNTEERLIYAIARDVTEERRNMSRYIQLHQAITDNVIYARTNSQGVITEVNDKFCDISGYDRTELLGKTHHIVNSGEHPKEFFVKMWQTISSGKTWIGPITNRRKTGELYYVKSIISPMFDMNGNIDAYMAIRFDITDRIEYQHELQKILQILNETSAIAKIGGWELNVETSRLSWTDETFKILGVTKQNNQTPILADGLELFTSLHKPIIDNAVSRAIEFGEPYALELQAQSSNGDLKWIFTNGQAHYENGKVVRLSGTIQDIHDKKITELKYNQERQKSIQNAKFAALGELAASIAHEINNPLGIISGYTELLKFQNDLKGEEKLDHILKSCERITHIVKNLKRFSRSEDMPVKSKINLTEIVKESISLTLPKMKRSLVSYSEELLEKAFINGNDIEIEQVVINLINNAIDAIQDNGERWIKISITDQQSHFMLQVVDSGNGITKPLQIKIFEPFFTTKDVNSGTGLGLSVVKGIVEDHNGTIEIDNKNPNTCFNVTFPKYQEVHNA